MSPVRLLVEREVREKLRSKAFVGTNVFLLVLVLAAVLLPALFADDEPTRFELAVVGEDAIATADLASALASADLALGMRLVDDDAAARALVVDDAVDGALLADGGLLAAEEPPGELAPLLAQARQLTRLDAALDGAGIDPATRGELLAPQPVEVEVLGESTGADEPDEAAFVVGFASVFVLYGLLIFYGQQVAQGLVQEKQSRVIEVLLAAVRPIDLLGGKLLGLGLLGLAQILLLTGTALLAIQLSGTAALPETATSAVVATALWFLGGYALYATVFALTGALVPRVEDLQSALMIPIMLLVGSLLVTQFAITDPDGWLATVGGVLPPVAPMYQPIAIALGRATVLSTVISAVGVIATTALLVPLTARVHAGASLELRSRVGLRDALRRSGDRGSG